MQNITDIEQSKEDKKIYGGSIAALVANLLAAPFIGVGTYMMYNAASNDSYIAAIIGTVTSILPLAMLLLIKKWGREKNILELNTYLFGKIFGNILNVILNLSYFFSAIVIFYNMVSFFNLHFLPDTDAMYIEILLLVAISYAVSKSSNIISKISQMIFILDLIFLAISPIGFLDEFEVSRIFPVMKNGTGPVIEASLKYFLMSAFPIFLVTIIPTSKIYSDKNNNRKIIFTYFLAHFCLIFVTFATIITMGEELLPLYRFPEYNGLKGFSLFNIIERIENTLSLQFLFCMFIFIVMCMHFNIKSITKVLKGNDSARKNEILSYILSILILVVTNIIFKSVIQSIDIITNIFPWVVLTGVIVPMIITCIGILASKKIRT